MSKVAMKIFFTKRFIRELTTIISWLEENASAGKAKEFLGELDNLIIGKIANHPTHFSEWKWKRTPQKFYRRAIFQKKYVLVFKHFENQIELLVIYHQKRDAEKIRL